MADLAIQEYLGLISPVSHTPGGYLWSSYDTEADTLYINFKKPSHATDSELTDDDVIVRYEGDEVIGLTILHASKRQQSYTQEVIMATKKTNYNKSSIANLPNNQPVLYRIETEGGKSNYVGTAIRGRVRERIAEHLNDIPGAKVRIEQFGSIADARAKESRVIKRAQPKYNKQGK